MSPPLGPCPECTQRIGNNRTRCRTCNRWAATVRRETHRILTTMHPRDTQRARDQAAATAYEQLARQETTS